MRPLLALLLVALCAPAARGLQDEVELDVQPDGGSSLDVTAELAAARRRIAELEELAAARARIAELEAQERATWPAPTPRAPTHDADTCSAEGQSQGQCKRRRQQRQRRLQRRAAVAEEAGEDEAGGDAAAGEPLGLPSPDFDDEPSRRRRTRRGTDREPDQEQEEEKRKKKTKKKVVGPEYLDSCERFEGPGGATRVCCMEENRSTGEFGLRCLPSFIVIGAQKTGTTALMGWLSLHENVTLAHKKEVHHFDTADKRRRVDGYVRSFKDEADPTTAVSGEASPAYMSFPNVCSNISELLPDVRLVALLRDPVDRAWSEYHMKARRIDNLDSMLDLLHSNASRVRSCAGLESAASITKCLPKQISEHALFSRLATTFKKFKTDPSQRRKFLSRCFNRQGGFRQTCLKELKIRGMYEKEPPPALDAFQEEADRMQNCLARNTTADMPLSRQMKRCSGATKGISRGYLWRGMYAPQLDWCLEALADPSQLLVLDSGVFRSDVQRALDMVTAHLGIPTMDASGVSEEELLHVLETEFGHMVKSTGWAMKGDYEPMTPEVEQWLSDFYEPYNAELFKTWRPETPWK